MREKDIETIFARHVRAAGAVTFKTVSPGIRGFPDRLVLAPGGRCFFVELKTQAGRVSANQTRVHAQMRGMGASVDILRSTNEIARWVAMNICPPPTGADSAEQA